MEWKSNEPLVIFGAGDHGRKIYEYLRRTGLDRAAVPAFIDDNPTLAGTSIEGIPVLPTDRLDGLGCRRAAVCIVNYSAAARIVTSLRARGYSAVSSFKLLSNDSTERRRLFGNPRVQNLEANRRALAAAGGKIDRALRLFEEPASRAYFVSCLAFLEHGDAERAPLAVSAEQYFPPDIIRLAADEVLYDCGAYRGETLAAFVRCTGGCFGRYVGFEADPTNYGQLEERAASEYPELQERIRLVPAAVADTTGTVFFSCAGTSASQLMSDGHGTPVDAVCIDDIRQSVGAPTFIKMDIEGAELQALHGAAQTIADCSPTLAISVYHEPEHFWEIPLLLHELNPAYTYYLRAHGFYMSEVVCYATSAE